MLETADRASVQVDMPLDRFEELNLAEGQQVYLTAKKVRVFVPDYVI